MDERKEIVERARQQLNTLNMTLQEVAGLGVTVIGSVWPVTKKGVPEGTVRVDLKFQVITREHL